MYAKKKFNKAHTHKKNLKMDFLFLAENFLRFYDFSFGHPSFLCAGQWRFPGSIVARPDGEPYLHGLVAAQLIACKVLTLLISEECAKYKPSSLFFTYYLTTRPVERPYEIKRL